MTDSITLTIPRASPRTRRIRRAMVVLALLLVAANAYPQALLSFRFPIAEEDYRAFTSPSGWRVSPTLHIFIRHEGIDIAAVRQAQVQAAADGWAEEIWPPPGIWWADGKLHSGHPVYGGYIVLRHVLGFFTAYAHMSAVLVTWKNQPVRAGQIIGNIGQTGDAHGEHLHFEIRLAELALNPLLYMTLPKEPER